jgi:hypothetical protein
MKSISSRITWGFIVILSFSNCARLLVGMKPIKEIDETAILKLGNKYDIPPKDLFELDTSYFTFLFSLDTNKFKTEIKNHYQPLQALYYNQDNLLTSFQVNCYAGGFPNLNWERDSIMKSFPPLKQAPIDSILPLATHLSFLHPLAATNEVTTSDYDYIVFVYWNRFMGRQSEHFIETIQKNKQLAGSLKVRYLYVNTDNCFASASKN